MAAELSLKGEQVPLPRINLERILSASTMKEWWSLLRASVGPELSQLHWDILSFCKRHELTPHQIQLRKNALACVERAVHEIWPLAETHLFGSTATGLALPWSDIDLVIMPPKHLGPAWRNPTTIAWQNALSRTLKRLGQCRSLQKIASAKVPLLKVVFNSGIACDISFDVLNSHAGVTVIRHFVEQYEASRPLCLVLKSFLGQNNLNQRQTGGLGSFCLITMVISHLQKTARIIGAGYGDLGTLLLSFLAYYSNIHRYSTDVVSTRPGFCGCKQDKGWKNKKNPQLLAVENPLDPTSDIGKGSSRIEQVRNKFSMALRALLTNWHNDGVLAEIVDSTSNTNQRPAAPSPEKSRKSKRGRRKKRRAASGQDEYITQQPASKIPRRYHPQQDSDLLAKSHMHRIMHNSRGAHFSSGLPPLSNRCRTGPDEEKFRPVQNVLAPVNPTQQDVDLWTKTQGHARGRKPNPSPEINPRKSGLTHQAAAELSRAQENNSKGSHCMQANSSTPRKQPRRILNHEIAENDSRPSLSVLSHLRRDGLDALGHLESQDEKINIEFWESQLTTRSKRRKTSLRGENQLEQCREVFRDQDSSTGSRFLETNLTPIISTRKDSKHQTTDAHRPMQSGQTHLTEGLDERVGRGNHDERILVDFWESHLATRSKPTKTSLRLSGPGVTDSRAQAEPSLHHELPQITSKIQPSAQDEKLLQDCGAGGNNEAVQAELAQYGSQIQSATQNKKPFEHCGTGGSTEQAAQTILNTAIQPSERSLTGSKIQPSSQDETLLVDLEFWEAKLRKQRKCKRVSLPILQSSPGLGKDGMVRQL